MSWLMLSDVARMLDLSFSGPDVAVEYVSTDTRKPDASALFFALKGENFDAHEVLASAPADVAAALVVSQNVDHPAPQLRVPDTRLALGQLAHACRLRFRGRLIGLTGSNGKTTVKEMIAAICFQAGQTLYTHGNLNNDIGVPLTLLRLREGDEFAVIEMGANHPGEIDYLTHLATPDVALLNNAGPAHLEGFGSIEGVAAAKGEIFSGLRAGGVAVINRDDHFASQWISSVGARTVHTFGQAAGADVRVVQFSPLTLDVAGERVEIELSLLGNHNALNAAGACAVALALGLNVEQMKAGLESLTPVAGRLRSLRGAQGACVIDDAYNANPGSIRAAIDTLTARKGVRILALGDMGEIGPDANKMHADVGAYARDAGIDALYACGPHSVHTVAAFGDCGRHFDDRAALIAALLKIMGEKTTVLVKGSRSVRMDLVVDGLVAKGGDDAS